MLTPPTATAPPLSSIAATHQVQLCHHHRSLLFQIRTFPSKRASPNRGRPSRVVLRPFLHQFQDTHMASGSKTYDPQLRSVLELATDSELYELERILFGSSYFSPLLKSVTKTTDVDRFMILEDLDERKDFISVLESRFFFLAADARSTLRTRKFFISKVSSKNGDECNCLELGLSQWKVHKLAALGIGTTELRSLIFKGGGMLTLEKLLKLLGGRLSGKLFSEAAKYQMKKEIIKKPGQLAAINLESGAALLAARQGLKAAAARYLGLRSVALLFGPMMWGTLLADVVIQMLGTDYARILRAIYALAQIQIYRSQMTASDIL